MLRRDFELENGIVCRGPINNFALYYKDTPITTFCDAISYVPGKLIAVRSNGIVTIFAPEVFELENEYVLTKIAIFKCYKYNAYMKVRIGESTYIIDSNVQIDLCDCRRFY